MIGMDAPFETRVRAKVGVQPHFGGTIHDAAAARRYGYRGALVPGICLYAHMSSLVVEAWGLPWVERGTMRSHSRRPVYDGDELTILFAPAQRKDDGLSVSMVVRNAEGKEVATGGATLPDRAAPSPELAAYPIRPLPERPPFFEAGALRPGQAFGAAEILVTPELHAESLAYFEQCWPRYAAEGIVHPTHLQRVVARNSNTSLAMPTPPIFVEGFAQHFTAARIGDRLTSSGVVTATYERNGNHYYDSENLVIANGSTPVALIRRTAIYAVRRTAAA